MVATGCDPSIERRAVVGPIDGSVQTSFELCPTDVARVDPKIRTGGIACRWVESVDTSESNCRNRSQRVGEPKSAVCKVLGIAHTGVIDGCCDRSSHVRNAVFRTDKDRNVATCDGSGSCELEGSGVVGGANEVGDLADGERFPIGVGIHFVNRDDKLFGAKDLEGHRVITAAITSGSICEGKRIVRGISRSANRSVVDTRRSRSEIDVRIRSEGFPRGRYIIGCGWIVTVANDLSHTVCVEDLQSGVQRPGGVHIDLHPLTDLELELVEIHIGGTGR